MKKILLSLSFSLATVIASAQIPNNGFENWTAVGSYSVPDGWGTMNNATASFSVATATKGSPGSPGNFYLKLTSLTTGSFVTNGIAVSGKLDSLTMLPKSGFAFNQRPASFTGKWQHMIYGSSQGSILVTLTRWDVGTSQRVTVGTASVTLSGMAMSWANFSLPFTYPDGGFPDTCIIVLKASGAAPTNNDYLWVDNLAFAGTIAGLHESVSFLDELKVYPNPASESLSLYLNLVSAQQVVIEIIDINGKLVRSKNLGLLQGQTNKTINVAGLAAGCYSLRVKGDKGVEVRKIVIE